MGEFSSTYNKKWKFQLHCHVFSDFLIFCVLNYKTYSNTYIFRENMRCMLSNVLLFPATEIYSQFF